MEPMNLLYIMSDQHHPRLMGCAGHATVRTPNLDALAQRGVRFTNAVTPCPICVPTRAAIATGRYVHQIGYWDNGTPYDGRVPSWGHRLTAQRYPVTTIGKLHYQGDDAPTGFPDQRLAMHVHRGEGDVYGLVRRPMPPAVGARRRLLSAGPGESDYSHYDRAVAAAACQWLREEAPRHARPWVLFVSLVCPHPPLKAPPEFYGIYDPERLDLPADGNPTSWSRHPALAALRRRQELEEPLDEATTRRALAAYHGLVSFMDDHVGQVLAALTASGQAGRTRIVYTSDHGEMMGRHGLWGKSTMFHDAVGVPLILAGPDLPRGTVTDEPVTLLDSFPTILAAVGAREDPDDADLPGRSLWPLAAGQPGDGRFVFAEYHAAGSETGIFMVRDRQHKYVHYVDMPPMLFDLTADPLERHDLAAEPSASPVLRRMAATLRSIVDPAAVDAAAKASQAALIDAAGGVAAVLAAGPAFIHGTPTPAQFLAHRADDAIH